MIDGHTLLARGWPSGPLIGRALALAESQQAAGLPESDVLALLDLVHADPVAILAGQPGFELAQAIAEDRRAPEAPVVRNAPGDFPIWGRELIDDGAVRQMHDAMRLPVTVAGALMPDAHIGYGVPIGGVVALDNAVAPYMVGVDIACRMMLSVYPADALAYLGDRRDALKRAMRGETRFGIGARFKPGDRRQHAVLDDPDWDATPLLQSLKDKAAAQLGTSGTGNHFVDAGRLDVGPEGAAALAIPEGEYLAVLTHSGSRGVGATIADRYSKRARTETPLPRELQALAWLGLDTELGQEYWTSMELAGRFASACHHTIHDALAAALGVERVAHVENHHNFAWRETHEVEGADGQPSVREVVVHRKGATPAGDGVLGVVPGSQGHPSYVVRGLGAAASLSSASHGAGRQMGRKQAIRTLDRAERDAWLEAAGVELLGSGMDEAPQAYKDIDEVLALQADLAVPVARFDPEVVLMASDGKSEG
ncbi:RtcB family protein [Rubrivirga sp.]|uniref:RtcB family protein n=1 Tax=Rubrivirga sp. TaxID=1885344 RepID=UPI003B527E6A